MDRELLEKNARFLVSPGRGILAADESNGTMSNRLEAVGVKASSETRRAYRANLFSTEGYESAISGVILFDETIRQTMKDGTQYPPNFPEGNPSRNKGRHRSKGTGQS